MYCVPSGENIATYTYVLMLWKKIEISLLSYVSTHAGQRYCSGVEIVVVWKSSDYQKFSRTTKDDDSSSPMEHFGIFFKYFSNFAFVMLFCLNLGHMTTTYI